jgi:hypothetical protein
MKCMNQLQFTEHGLYRLVEKRLDELKNKNGWREQRSCKQNWYLPQDILDTAMRTILQSVEAEQIYISSIYMWWDNDQYICCL